jgi:hypothetical protein
VVEGIGTGVEVIREVVGEDVGPVMERIVAVALIFASASLHHFSTAGAASQTAPKAVPIPTTTSAAG